MIVTYRIINFLAYFGEKWSFQRIYMYAKKEIHSNDKTVT